MKTNAILVLISLSKHWDLDTEDHTQEGFRYLLLNGMVTGDYLLTQKGYDELFKILDNFN